MEQETKVIIKSSSLVSLVKHESSIFKGVDGVITLFESLFELSK